MRRMRKFDFLQKMPFLGVLIPTPRIIAPEWLCFGSIDVCNIWSNCFWYALWPSNIIFKLLTTFTYIVNCFLMIRTILKRLQKSWFFVFFRVFWHISFVIYTRFLTILNKKKFSPPPTFFSKILQSIFYKWKKKCISIS